VIIIALIPLALRGALPATGHGGAAAEEPVRFIRPLRQVQPRHENIDRLDFPKTALPLRQVHKHLNIAVRFTIVTTIVLGLIYPLLVTGLSQLIFPRQANGSLVEKNGQIIGSRLIAQGFTAVIYFHPRPSAAGAGMTRRRQADRIWGRRINSWWIA
jgi:hypothetical protein